MAELDVRCEPTPDGWTCAVVVRDASGETGFTVGVDRATLGRLQPGSSEPAGLVRASFEFLLERESKESILRRFPLPVIGRYFPEYEATIRNRLGG